MIGHSLKFLLLIFFHSSVDRAGFSFSLACQNIVDFVLSFSECFVVIGLTILFACLSFVIGAAVVVVAGISASAANATNTAFAM